MTSITESNGFQGTIYQKNGFGRTPIQEACLKGNIAQVTELLTMEPGLQYETDQNHRGLTHFAALSGNKELFAHLVSLNPDSLVYPDEGDNTPLHLAAQEGNLEVVEEAIRLAEVHQVDILNLKNMGFKTPLMLAASNHHRDVVRYLISNGANTNASDFHDRTVFHICALNRDWEILDELLDANPKGARHEELYFLTPLDYAAAAGHERMMSKLIQCGAKVNHVAHDGRRAIHHAARNNHVGAIRLLKEQGAKLNVQERDSGMTPLHEAVFFGHAEAIQVLKDLGADLSLGDTCGDAPIAWARQGKNEKIIRILEN